MVRTRDEPWQQWRLAPCGETSAQLWPNCGAVWIPYPRGFARKPPLMAATFQCQSTLTRRLVADGWLSPDTYSKHFAPPSSDPAVYLFALYGDELLETALVAYVGMTVDLTRRWARHEVLPELEDAGHYVRRWFKPTARNLLRDTETAYIRSFDPPWNTIGRPRGVTR